MIRALTVSALVTCTLLVNTAYATYDPCYVESRQVYSAERQVGNAQRNLDNSQNQLTNAQNQVEMRLLNMRFQVDQAQANIQAAGAVTGGIAAGCAIRSIFYRGVRCWGGVASSAIMRQAYARRSYNMAVTRYNSYVTYAGGYLARMAQRVLLAQQQYDQAKAAYGMAAGAYQQCSAPNSQIA